MAEFSLPANSVVKQGKLFAAGEGVTNIKRFIVYRYDPIWIAVDRWYSMAYSKLKTRWIRPFLCDAHVVREYVAPAR